MRSPKIFSLRNKFIFVSATNILLTLVLVVGISYSKMVSVVEDQISRSNFQFVEQVADNISVLFKDMKNSSVYLLQNKEFMNYLRLSEEEIGQDAGHLLSIQKFINNYLAFNTNIHSIYLEAFNGVIFDSQSARNIIDPALRSHLLGLRGDGIFIPDVITNYNGTQTDVFSYIKIIKDPDNLAIDLALLKINTPQTLITKTFSSVLDSPSSLFYLVDENGIIISAIKRSMIDAPLPAELSGENALKDAGGYFHWTVDGKETLVTHCQLNHSTWKLVHLVPLEDLSHDITIIRNITLASILLSLACCFWIVIFFSVLIFRPLKQLRKAMGKVEKEDFGVNIPVHGNDEIALLSRSFNKMSSKLDELVNQVLAVEIKEREAELKALQAQIHPHFLYNTLDTIYWTCRMEKATDSALLVKSLARLFRLSLNSGEELTTVGREVEHLELYLAIQQKRFEGQISFAVNVAEGLGDCNVVKLILQPLVENSIVHGIEKKGGTGHIQVDVYADNGVLIYTVHDNGAGADPEEVSEYLRTVGADNRGFALNNVNERIRIYCGDGYGLTFDTSLGNGMTVTVRQPLAFSRQTLGGM